MINVNVLWASAMGAISGAIIYVTGREDGQKEGLVAGYMAGAIETATGEKVEVEID
jgi:uncharacterized membrane protein